VTPIEKEDNAVPTADRSSGKPVKRRFRFGRRLIELGVFVAAFIALQAWMTRDVVRGTLPPLDGTLLAATATSATDWQRQRGREGFVLYVWATWCPICKTVEHNVDAVAQDAPVLTVAMNSGDLAAVRRFLEARGKKWDTLIDGEGALARQLGIDAVPTLLFVDRAGVVRSVTQGYTSEIGIRLRLWWARRGAA